MDNGLAARVRTASVAAMAFLRELFRQGRQNRHDILELYGLDEKTNKKVNVIADVQQEHGRRLDSIDGRLGNVEGRLGNVEGRLGNVEGRLSTIEETHGGKLDEILGILRKVP